MNIRDLIPWSRSGRETPGRREGTDPIQALQSGIDRVFEDFWRSVEQSMGGAGSASLPRVDVRGRTRRSRSRPSCPAWTRGTSSWTSPKAC